jgi:hypothetical protein
VDEKIYERKGNKDNKIIMITGVAFQILYVPVFEATSDWYPKPGFTLLFGLKIMRRIVGLNASARENSVLRIRDVYPGS